MGGCLVHSGPEDEGPPLVFGQRPVPAVCGKAAHCPGHFFRRRVNFVDTSVKRGDIYYADLSPVVGSEQGGVRPVLIVQNDTGNRYSPTVIVAAITSQTG